MKSHHPTAWLWKLALLVMATGGTISYMLWRNISDADSRGAFSTSVFLTVLISGICLICATSNWWLKR